MSDTMPINTLCEQYEGYSKVKLGGVCSYHFA
jgi:hypothetical protein